FFFFFFFQAEDGIRDLIVTGVQTCALPICMVSTESAISSRLGREYFMPTWPMAMPSSTPIVLNKNGTPPASRTHCLTYSPTACRSEERRVGKEGRCRWGREQ